MFDTEKREAFRGLVLVLFSSDRRRSPESSSLKVVLVLSRHPPDRPCSCLALDWKLPEKRF